MSFESLIARLPEAFAKELSERFATLKASNPSETFYGIATCHECDTCSCYLTARTEEAIQRELEERAGGGPVSGLSFDRYWVPEWEYANDKAFTNELHDQIWSASEAEGLDYVNTKRQVFDAYVSGLRLFEANGGLHEFTRDKFILIPWFHDPGDENVWVLQAVSDLNPKAVSDAFAEEYAYAD